MSSPRASRLPVSAARQLRLVGGWRQLDVASAAGLSLRRVAQIESGDVGGVRLRELVGLAEALGCSVVDLVPGLAFRPKVGRLKARGR